METQMFRIKIGEREFIIDEQFEEFREVSKGNILSANSIPICQFRYKDGCWFILWDKEFATYYAIDKQRSHPIPLSVEWVQVTFIDDKTTAKEYLDMIILLSETLSIIRNRCRSEKFRKSDGVLKKWLSQFNKS